MIDVQKEILSQVSDEHSAESQSHRNLLVLDLVWRYNDQEAGGLGKHIRWNI